MTTSRSQPSEHEASSSVTRQTCSRMLVCPSTWLYRDEQATRRELTRLSLDWPSLPLDSRRLDLHSHAGQSHL